MIPSQLVKLVVCHYWKGLERGMGWAAGLEWVDLGVQCTECPTQPHSSPDHAPTLPECPAKATLCCFCTNPV